MKGDLTKRLPVEMLARIFHAWKDTSWWNKEHGLRAEWVCATWICKRWRDVALDTPTLWSSVLVTGRLADIRALEAQLDRAWRTPLDLLVLSRGVPIKGLKAALKLVLRKKKQVENLKVVYDIEQDTIIEGFVKGVSAKLDSLLLRPNEYLHPDDEGWEFTPINFPCLSKLDVKAIIPVWGAPMLNLTHLLLKNSVDDLSTDAETPWRRVHVFLEACPNLEYLEVTYDFGYPTIRRDPQCLYRGLPVVTLPKLRALSLDWLALDISTALATLRLPALSSFHILGDCGLDNPEDADFFVVPQNISTILPELRRTRSLSLVVPVDSHCEDLCLEGTSRDPAGTSSNGTTHRDSGTRRTAEDYWSITLPNLESLTEEFRGTPCCIWYNTARFLARIPHVVDPAALVSLELHIANGLPVTRDWARFFRGIVHLERLEIGGATLIRNVFEAFEMAAESGRAVLCAELEEVALCFGVAKRTRRVDNRGRPLSELVPRVIGAWVRARARPLKMLTVLMRAGAGAEGGSGVQSGSSSSSEDEDDDEDQPALSHGTQPTESTEPGALRLWRDLEAALKLGGSVKEVVLAEKCCCACDEVYETVDADEFGTGELREGVAYY